ncbi:MAG: hypothetical protein HYT67_01025 [Candidatus Yanofskybacteria bacterium]|nr:hypothetical protein [Candidatus Yanofskybacteria bacterium]
MGGQERGLRAGTENLPAILGLVKAVSLIKKEEGKRLTVLRDYFMQSVKSSVFNTFKDSSGTEKEIQKNLKNLNFLV